MRTTQHIHGKNQQAVDVGDGNLEWPLLVGGYSLSYQETIL